MYVTRHSNVTDPSVLQDLWDLYEVADEPLVATEIGSTRYLSRADFNRADFNRADFNRAEHGVSRYDALDCALVRTDAAPAPADGERVAA